MKLSARGLRDLPEESEIPNIKRRPLYFILDNVLDTYNIGGLFRLADALAVSKIYICGESEVPPNHKIKKASVGTYKIVPWEYCETAVEAIRKVREQKTEDQKVRKSESQKVGESDHPSSVFRPPLIVSIEQHKKSVPYTDFKYDLPLAFVVGNETHGVSPEAIAASDAIVEIPMFGINKSLNVIVSTAIVSYHALSD